MALQFEAERTVTICAGAGGTGKSTFALRYLVNAPLETRFIFDPENEYSKRLNMPAATTAFELNYQLCQGWVLFDPHTLFPGKLQEAFAFFCDWAFALSERLPGRKVLQVDEIWKYCSPQSIPDELALCVQTGRKRGMQMLFNTQLPNRLNLALRSECSEMVCFRLLDKKPLETAQEKGFDPDELRQLPNLSFISRSDLGGELRGQLAI